MTLGLFVHLKDKDTDNFKVVRARVYELGLEETEQLIKDHLRIPQLKATFLKKLEPTLNKTRKFLPLD